MLDVAHSSLTTATDDTRENSRHNTGTLSGDFRTLSLQGTVRESKSRHDVDVVKPSTQLRPHSDEVNLYRQTSGCGVLKPHG